MISRQHKRYYAFDGFRIDITERVLLCKNGVVHLTPKAFDTLLVLVENSGHVVTKNELMERVWPDSFVEENNLVQHISALRKALRVEGDNERKFIETVPKRGYRFAVDVRESIGVAGGRPERLPEGKWQSDQNRLHHEKSRSFLRDVVVIGRAVEFQIDNA